MPSLRSNIAAVAARRSHAAGRLRHEPRHGRQGRRHDQRGAGDRDRPQGAPADPAAVRALRRRGAAAVRQHDRPAHRGPESPAEAAVHLHRARQRRGQRLRTAGGYVYITRGIMAYLNSEAELDGRARPRNRPRDRAACRAAADRRDGGRRRRHAGRHPHRQRRPGQRRQHGRAAP